MQKSVNKGLKATRKDKMRKLNLFLSCEVRITEVMTGISCYGNCGKERIWEWQVGDGRCECDVCSQIVHHCKQHVSTMSSH